MVVDHPTMDVVNAFLDAGIDVYIGKWLGNRNALRYDSEGDAFLW